MKVITQKTMWEEGDKTSEIRMTTESFDEWIGGDHDKLVRHYQDNHYSGCPYFIFKSIALKEDWYNQMGCIFTTTVIFFRTEEICRNEIHKYHKLVKNEN